MEKNRENDTIEIGGLEGGENGGMEDRNNNKTMEIGKRTSGRKRKEQQEAIKDGRDAKNRRNLLQTMKRGIRRKEGI